MGLGSTPPAEAMGKGQGKVTRESVFLQKEGIWKGLQVTWAFRWECKGSAEYFMKNCVGWVLKGLEKWKPKVIFWHERAGHGSQEYREKVWRNEKITLYENDVNRCWWNHAAFFWMDLTGRSAASWWCEVDGLGVTLTGQIEIKCNYG